MKVTGTVTKSHLKSNFAIHEPPLLRLLTMSAFEGTPLPPQCGRRKWKPPKKEVGLYAGEYQNESNRFGLGPHWRRGLS